MKINTVLILMLLFLTASQSLSQNITNTLGANGLFKVKGPLNEILSISQSSARMNISGNLNLMSATDTSRGIFMKSGKSFLHDYKASGTDGYNIFMGESAGNFSLLGENSASSSYNIGIGYKSLNKLTNGSYNTSVGINSLMNNTSGYSNSAVGYYSLPQNTSGSYNSAFGILSLENNSTGNYNSGNGYKSLSQVNSGSGNTGSGCFSLFSVTTGNNNTGIGNYAGISLVSGSNNTIIGYNSTPSSPTVSNQITLGNNQITSLRCNVQSITSLSDQRDKKEIQKLSLGLDFILKLKPRQFKWDKREWYQNDSNDGSKMQKEFTAGFIAQELDETQESENADWLGLVLKDNPDKMEATYGNLLPVIVKAIQDLKGLNDELKDRNKKLESELVSLKSEIRTLRSRISNSPEGYSQIKNN